MDQFRAFRVHQDDGKTNASIDTIGLDDLGTGDGKTDVVIKACWSDINYKDALAATGKGRIMRRFPMVAGIDVAGYVASSRVLRVRLPGVAISRAPGCGPRSQDQ